jgi:Phosphoribosylanthranilate isomerase
MKVKICGISNEIDALLAIEKGADAIGFVMGGRVLPVEVEPLAQHVREAIKKFPEGIDSFVVTHLFSADDILSLANYVNSTGIQISEDIPLEEVIKIRNSTDKKIIKTIVSNDPEAKVKQKLYEPYCDYFLLDSRYGGYTGGTGVTNSWEACKELIDLTDKPVFIAGGLDPENVSDAIKITNPYGVDVSTGISCYGSNYLKKDRKDPNKIERFIKISKED